MAERLSDDALAHTEMTLAHGQPVPPIVVRALIAEVRELRAERAWVVKVEADARAEERAGILRLVRCLPWDFPAGRVGDAIERGDDKR